MFAARFLRPRPTESADARPGGVTTSPHQMLLIAAPTRVGKTAAAFLAFRASINDLVVEGLNAGSPRIGQCSTPRLAAEGAVQLQSENPQEPLAGIPDKLLEHGPARLAIRGPVAHGYTTAVERTHAQDAPHSSGPRRIAVFSL